MNTAGTGRRRGRKTGQPGHTAIGGLVGAVYAWTLYFNNDLHGHAVRNAICLREVLG